MPRKESTGAGSLALAALVNLLISTVFYVLITTMAIYTGTRFGIGDGLADAAAASFVIGATVARVFAGLAVSRLTAPHTLMAALTVFVPPSSSTSCRCGLSS